MLDVDFSKRLTAEQCLASTFFDEIRAPLIEKPSEKQLKLEIDQIGVFDYTNAISLKFTKENYLEMIWNES